MILFCVTLHYLLVTGINKLLEQYPVPEGQYSTWVESINEVREKFPMWYPEKDDVIIPQWAIQVIQRVMSWSQCRAKETQKPQFVHCVVTAFAAQVAVAICILSSCTQQVNMLFYPA